MTDAIRPASVLTPLIADAATALSNISAPGQDVHINVGTGASVISLFANNSSVTTQGGPITLTGVGNDNTYRLGDGEVTALILGNRENFTAGNGNLVLGYKSSDIDINHGNGPRRIVDLAPQTGVGLGTRVWGDPHYNLVGSNGEAINFDHHGTAGRTYSIFEGDNLLIDGLYSPYGNAPSIISRTTVRAGDDTLIFDANSNAVTLNGNRLNLGQYTLRDGSSVNYTSTGLAVSSNDGTGVVNITDNGGWMTISPTGQFGNLGGIIGTAISQNRALSEAEANTFDITDGRTQRVTAATNPFDPNFLAGIQL